MLTVSSERLFLSGQTRARSCCLRSPNDAAQARNGLQTIRYSDTNLLLALESAIGAGTPLLIEDCLEELDPVLDPLLTKQLSLQSGRRVPGPWVLLSSVRPDARPMLQAHDPIRRPGR